MNPQLQQQAQAIAAKWEGFVGKVNQRVNDVVSEADAGINQLIAQNATDPGPMGAAMNAVQARFHGLDQKVDESWEKIEEEWAPLEDMDEWNEQDYDGLQVIMSGMRRQYDQLRDHIEMTYHLLEGRKQADWARQLNQLVIQEYQRGVACSQCGSPFQNPTYWASSTITCPSCGSVNNVSPGMASGLFYQGLGIHALSQEAALEEWKAERQAERAFNKFRNPTDADFQQYLQAGRNYWTRYYQESQRLHPGFAQAFGSIEAAVEAKMAHYTQWVQPLEQTQRAFYGQLVNAAATNDPASIKAVLGRRPDSIDLDDCAMSLVEHQQLQGAKVVLTVKHAEDNEDEPVGRWVAEQIRDIQNTLKD